ncbi:MAG: zinc ribbon domain-containing protein [Proteobacteria bacterium]|nr:zinc ribbon domain-containing protein [Pseudomonadota bacterium]
MPIYEYKCERCERQFEVLLKTTEKAKCPHCGGAKLKQQLSVFAVGGASGGGMDALPDACRSCGDPRGPGACGMR